MKTSRLLYLSAHQMTAFRWQSGVLHSEGLFAASEEGFRQFEDYLATHTQSIYSILANVSEEGFQIETIPFVRGADRQAIIQRKLGQLFFNATLTATQSLGYEKSKRKNERILLAALPNNDFFAPWLARLAEAGAALAGIFSLPLLAPAFLRKLKLAEDHCLLLTVQDQSIRQSYIERGELHFSRLTPLQNSSIGGIAQTLSAEAIKLQQYLTSQRLIGRNQPITAHVLAHANALKAIEQSCIDTGTIRFNILDIGVCARQSGLKTPPKDSHCEQLFLNLLASNPPRVQFADDTLRHQHHLGQIRSALYGSGSLALLACVIFSGKLLFETHSIGQEALALKAEAGLSRQRYEYIVATFPPIPTNSDTLRRIIDRYTELEKASTTPSGLYREISRALGKAPAAELDSIDWSVGGADPAAGKPANIGAAAKSVAGDSETALVRGTLKLGPNANARQMLNAFNQLLEALQNNPLLQVDVLQRPFDIESGKSLKGTEITVEDNKPRSFALQITRKLAP